MKIDAWRRGCATSTRLSKANIGAAAYALDADGAQHQVERVICKNDIESKPASNVLTGETSGNRTSLTFRERCVGITLPTFDLRYIHWKFSKSFFNNNPVLELKRTLVYPLRRQERNAVPFIKKHHFHKIKLNPEELVY